MKWRYGIATWRRLLAACDGNREQAEAVLRMLLRQHWTRRPV